MGKNMDRRMKTLVTVFILITAIASQINSADMVFAEGSVEVSASLEDTGIVYNINNTMNESITNIEIIETLKNKNGEVVDNSSINGGSIPAGSRRLFKGNNYSGIKGKHTIYYSVQYKLEGQEEWKNAGEGEKTLNTAEIRINVSYSAKPSSDVQKGQSVTYTAQLKSSSNIPVNNITIEDSVFGIIGVISTLNPGETKSVSKDFTLQNTTDSHVILKFDDPLGGGGQIVNEMQKARLKITTSDKALNPRVEISGKPDLEYIPAPTDVTFTFQVKNTGDAVLSNIRCIDWNGKVFFTQDTLEPGQTVSAQMTNKMEPDRTYEINCIAAAQEGGQKVQKPLKIKVPKLDPKVEIERNILTQNIKPGDKVVIEYNIKNTGNIPLADIVVEEPDWGEIGKFDSLDAGAQTKFKVEKVLNEDFTSKTMLTAKETVMNTEYSYEAGELLISVNGSSEASLSVEIRSEPGALEKAGTVQIECIVKNLGNTTVHNVEAILKERDLTIGSFVQLQPGEERVIKTLPLEVEETQDFTAIVKCQDDKGNSLQFTSKPLTIQVGEKAAKNLDNEGKIVLLRTILTIIILLIVFAAGTLIYVIKSPGRNKNKIPGKKGKHVKRK